MTHEEAREAARTLYRERLTAAGFGAGQADELVDSAMASTLVGLDGQPDLVRIEALVGVVVRGPVAERRAGDVEADKRFGKRAEASPPARLRGRDGEAGWREAERRWPSGGSDPSAA